MINSEIFLCLIFFFISFFVDVCYRIRGTLCTILVLGSTGGVLLGFIAGHFLEYAEAPRFALIFPILYIAFFSFMPETPYYLMKTNRMEVRLTFSCSLIFSFTVFFFFHISIGLWPFFLFFFSFTFCHWYHHIFIKHKWQQRLIEKIDFNFFWK